MEDPVWFPPLNVIHHGDLLRKSLSAKEKKSKRFRKVVEAYTVAQMLVGIMVKENKDYWMQIVEDKFSSPDIRTIRYADSHDEKFDFLEQVDVEVVEYESHSEMSIPEFIVEKKFSKYKSYDENTIILCHVGSGVKSFLPDGETIKKMMEPINSPCEVLLLVGTSPEATELDLISLKPNVGVLLTYIPAVELSKRKNKSVVTFKLGTRKPTTYNPNNKHYPFEKLGYVPNDKGKYEGS